MSVTPDDVRRIAALARVAVRGGDLEGLTADLNRILEHVDALRSVGADEASDLTPQIVRPLDGTRADELEVPDTLERGPSHFAPRFDDGFFVVPPPPGLERTEPSE